MITVQLHHHNALSDPAAGWRVDLARVPVAGERVDIFDVRLRVHFVVHRVGAPPIIALEPAYYALSASLWTTLVARARAEQQALQDKLEAF